MFENTAVFCGYEGGRRNYVSTLIEENVNLSGHEILVRVFACNISEIQHDAMIDLLSKVQNLSITPSTCISGEVVDIGSNVTSTKIKDRVVCFIPLDSARSGCANYCIVNDFDTVVFPQQMDFNQVVATISSGVKAYLALQYLTRINHLDTILIFDAGSACGSLSVQLAKMWGTKVLAVASKLDKLYLENLSHAPDHIIEMESLSNNLSNIVMKETSGLGANIIIDNGVKLFANEEDSLAAKDDTSMWKPLKHEIISCLAPGGRWVTTNPLLQIDPSDSLQLFLLGASVNFLFEHLWSLAPTSQGKLIHVAKDLLKKLEMKLIEPRISTVVNFSDLVENVGKLAQVDRIVVSLSDL